jgi:hypothetical protein
MPLDCSADRHGIRGNLSYADCWLSGYDAVGETHAALSAFGRSWNPVAEVEFDN